MIHDPAHFLKNNRRIGFASFGTEMLIPQESGLSVIELRWDGSVSFGAKFSL